MVLKNQKRLDSFGGANGLLADAYLIWALLECGVSTQTLEKEILAIQKAMIKNSDPYCMALVANIFIYREALRLSASM